MNNLLIIFGFTGDLVKRKILKSLYSLYLENNLKNIKILGISRRNWEQSDLKNYIMEVLGEVEDSFFNLFLYEKIDFDSKDNFEELEKYYAKYKSIYFYLAVKPENICQIIGQIPANQENFNIMLEKPIGTNLDAFLEIEKTLSKIFSPKNIFRLDHYLHKPIVAGIKDFRKYSIFEYIWNDKYVESIKINLNEVIDIEGRGEFYEKTGALIDVGQNHILQYLALVTAEMEDGNISTTSKNEIIENLFLNPNTLILGQYEGYLEEKEVAKDSIVETYFYVEGNINNGKWMNTKIILESGKALKTQKKNIEIKFFNGNSIDFDFNIGVDISLKLPKTVTYMNSSNENARYIGEYKKALSEFLTKDNDNFITFGEVNSSWKAFNEILSLKDKKLKIYKKNAIETLQVENEDKTSSFEVGILGLGKMGMGVFKNLYHKGIKAKVFNRSQLKLDEIVEYDVEKFTDLELFTKSFSKPVILLLFLPNGIPTNEILYGKESVKGLKNLLEKDSVVVDCGNSFFEDSIYNFHEFKKIGIDFVDAGISGGPKGAKFGATAMLGAEKNLFAKIECIFKAFCLPNAYLNLEKIGAGHFVKMVHNAIEYGMMQSIAEGFEIIKLTNKEFSLKKIAKLYNTGSVIESRLVGWMLDAFLKHGENLKDISSVIEQNGEAIWTVEHAKKIKANCSSILLATEFRKNSSQNEYFASKAISAMRGEFGGHNVIIKD